MWVWPKDLLSCVLKIQVKGRNRKFWEESARGAMSLLGHLTDLA